MIHRVNVSNIGGLMAKPVHDHIKLPTCVLCSHKEHRIVEVGSVNFKNEPGHGDKAELLMRCHGAEELVTIDMGTRIWTYQEANKRLMRGRYFDPAVLAGVAEER